MRCWKAIHRKFQDSSYENVQRKENQCGNLARKASQKGELSWKKSGSIHWPLGYCVFVNFLSITEAWIPGINNRQAGGRRHQGARRAIYWEYHLWRPASLPSAPARYPLQSRVTPHLQDGAPAHVSSQFFPATLTWLLSRLSLFFILGIKEIQIAMHLSAVVPSSQPMDRACGTMLDLELWCLAWDQTFCSSLEFLQPKYQITLRFTFSLESCPKHLLMFAASDYPRAREGQEENLLFFQSTFEK